MGFLYCVSNVKPPFVEEGRRFVAVTHLASARRQKQEPAFREYKITMNRLKRIFKRIIGFFDRVMSDHVSAYAAQSSYFMLLSFIPFILLVMTSVRFTPLTEIMVNDAIIHIIPEEFQTFVRDIIREVYTRSTAMLPITAILTLWSAGRGIQGLTNGLNSICHTVETRNYFAARIRSAFYTLLFLVAIVFTMVLMIFGNEIQGVLEFYVPLVADITRRIINMRTGISLATMSIILLMIYKFLPNRKASFKSLLPGAVLGAVLWSAFSLGFSLYLDYFGNFGNMYGSLTTIILIMLWMYFMMYIILIGAEINENFEDKFRKLQAFIKKQRQAGIEAITKGGED